MGLATISGNGPGIRSEASRRGLSTPRPQRCQSKCFPRACHIISPKPVTPPSEQRLWRQVQFGSVTASETLLMP
jgi:hypothetical protein